MIKKKEDSNFCFGGLERTCRCELTQLQLEHFNQEAMCLFCSHSKEYHPVTFHIVDVEDDDKEKEIKLKLVSAKRERCYLCCGFINLGDKKTYSTHNCADMGIDNFICSDCINRYRDKDFVNWCVVCEYGYKCALCSKEISLFDRGQYVLHRCLPEDKAIFCFECFFECNQSGKYTGECFYCGRIFFE